MSETVNGQKSHIMMITSLLIVGSIGVIRRYIPLSSSLLAFFRGLIGSASLLLFAVLTEKKILYKVSAKKAVLMLLTGAVLGINWILLFEAFNYTTIPKATLAYYMQPTIVLLTSPFIFGEKLTKRKSICAMISLIGMILVSGVIGNADNAADDTRGILLGLAAACFYSLVIIFNKKNEGVDPYQKSIIQLLTAAILLIPYLLIGNEFSNMELNIKVILSVLIVGIIHTGLVYILYFGSMTGLKAQTISVLSYIDPVTAMIISAIILKEGLNIPGMFGALLIIGSSICHDLPHS